MCGFQNLFPSASNAQIALWLVALGHTACDKRLLYKHYRSLQIGRYHQMTNVISHDALQGPQFAARSAARAADVRVGLWLFVVSFLVLCMVIVGGATRLTDSGLSITEWNPIKGTLPPLSATDWASEFERYRTIPEYIKQNKGMSLAEFQFIYWWEWSHRFLGRFVGLAFALPLVIFLVTKQIKKGLGPWLCAMFLLGGLQGAIGWWMVSSGLTGDRLDVAAYRLATHLSMAFILMALTAWTAMDLVAPKRVGSGDKTLMPWIALFLIFLATQIVMGAFVAGTDAGMINNDWPTFAGGWFPSDYAALEPFAHNLVENRSTIQFNHRIGAYVIAIGAAFLWNKSRVSSDANVRIWGHTVAALVIAQVVLGVSTLIGYGIWTPPQIEGVILGIGHQALGAILLTASALWLRAAVKEKPQVGLKLV
jgi:heme a synthase